MVVGFGLAFLIQEHHVDVAADWAESDHGVTAASFELQVRAHELIGLERALFRANGALEALLVHVVLYRRQIGRPLRALGPTVGDGLCAAPAARC